MYGAKKPPILATGHQLAQHQDRLPPEPVHGEHGDQVAGGLYQDSQQRVEEDVPVEVDAVHGEAVVAKVDCCPVDIIRLILK